MAAVFKLQEAKGASTTRVRKAATRQEGRAGALWPQNRTGERSMGRETAVSCAYYRLRLKLIDAYHTVWYHARQGQARLGVSPI